MALSHAGLHEPNANSLRADAQMRPHVLGMQTTNMLLLGVGALSVAAQASLPRVAETIARFFARRHHPSTPCPDCHG
jgi:hypothetical protein